jgi:hypothetical protein
MINDAEQLLMFLFAIYSFWRNVYSSPLPISELGLLLLSFKINVYTDSSMM